MYIAVTIFYAMGRRTYYFQHYLMAQVAIMVKLYSIQN